MYDVIKYIWSLEDFKERFAAMAMFSEPGRFLDFLVSGSPNPSLWVSWCLGYVLSFDIYGTQFPRVLRPLRLWIFR
jgi:hypothetical protein